jgi:hypothetical protein
MQIGSGGKFTEFERGNPIAPLRQLTDAMPQGTRLNMSEHGPARAITRAAVSSMLCAAYAGQKL